MTDSKLVRRKKALDILSDRAIHLLDIAETLYVDGVISLQEMQTLKSAEDKQLELFKLIEMANKTQKISLLDYEWTLLPTQKIKLTIVTQHGVREFAYEEP